MIEILSLRTGGWHQQLYIEILCIFVSEGKEAYVKLLTEIVNCKEINKTFPSGWKTASLSFKIACNQTSPTISTWPSPPCQSERRRPYWPKSPTWTSSSPSSTRTRPRLPGIAGSASTRQTTFTALKDIGGVSLSICNYGTCHMSHVTCHMSYVKCLCWSLGHAEQFLFSCLCSKVSICNYVTCHISHVTCHIAYVRCHIAHFTCHVSNAYVDPWFILNNFCFHV